MGTPSLATVGGVTLSPGYAGQKASSGPEVVESRLNEAAATIDFGVAVTAGVAVAAGKTPNCKKLDTNGQVPIGISLRAPSNLIADSSNVVNYARYEAVPVLKMGDIFAIAAENVTAEDAVVVLPASANNLGGTTGGAANGTSRMAFSGAKWLTTTASGALGRVRISTP